jgi:hypothetical protein
MISLAVDYVRVCTQRFFIDRHTDDPSITRQDRQDPLRNYVANQQHRHKTYDAWTHLQMHSQAEQIQVETEEPARLV